MEYEKQLQMLAEYWKEQFEIETAKVNVLIYSLRRQIVQIVTSVSFEI